MRTRTIYSAVEGAEHIWNPHGIDHGDVYPNRRVDRAERQCRKFYAELLRRMDERDEAQGDFARKTAAWMATIDRLKANVDQLRGQAEELEAGIKWMADMLIDRRAKN